MKFKILQILTVVLSISLQTACRKLIEVEAPITSYNAANVYSNNETAISVITGIYTKLGRPSGGTFATGAKSLSLLAGLSGDEFTLYGGVSSETFIAYYKNSLTPSANTGSEYWSELYNYIFSCNAAIEGLNKSKDLRPLVKQQLIGEAKFMRAFFNFYLVNLFGDIPLVTTTDYKESMQLGRTSKEKVYQQIIADLREAQTLLSLDYLDGNLQPYTGTLERLRPTKWAATALLSRVYLYTGDYTNAETQASQVINNSQLYRLTELNSTFLMNSDEAIWQLQPVNYGRNTEDALTFTIPETGPSDENPVYLRASLLNNFESHDQRKINWTNSIAIGTDTLHYPYKYKSAMRDAPVTEYLTVLRLAEQYLIRAEARAYQNDFGNAIADINSIRNRAGLTEITATSQQAILNIIWHERQVELFSEWGHRWLDLKRTGRVNEVMKTVTLEKGGVWNSTWQLYPILPSDIQRNTNLTQNPGY